MHRTALVFCALVLLFFQPTGAQAPATAPAAPAAPKTTTPSKLPVRRIVLYKNGVGYFEHVGRVHGNEAVAIDFNTSQLNDVLKSLTTLDLGGGRITGVSYNSEAPLAKRLGALRLPIGEHTTLAQLLDALRGSRIEAHTATGIVTGRLLGVERRTTRHGDETVARDEMTLVSDAGDVRLVEITPSVTVRLAERDTTDQVGTYLGLLASTRAQDRRRMSIATSGTGDRDLLVSYVSEVPVWKTTYRIVLPSRAGGKPLLQGWAIIDNTIGEDWRDVELSLVAGAPQSFIQQISQPLYAQRPVVPLPKMYLTAPQTHGGTLEPGVGGVDGTITDESGAALPGVTVTIRNDSTGQTVTTTTDPDGDYNVAGLPSGRYTVEYTLTGFQSRRSQIEVEGGFSTTQDAQLGIGALAETVEVSGDRPARKSLAYAARAGNVMPAAAPMAAPPREQIEARLQDQQAAALGRELGDLFEYRVSERISIGRNQSALVPIVRSEVAAERVSVWTPKEAGGRPLRSVWLTNSSGLTLDGGSFTVLDGGTFAGEGLVDAMKPGERRLLSYAVDLGVLVEPKNGDERRTVTRITIARGVLTEHGEQLARRAYTIRNSDTSDRQVVIEHPIRSGWKLAGDLHPAETSTDAYRFVVPVASGKTETFAVTERHDLGTTYRVSDINDQQLAVILRDSGNSDAVRQALAPVLAKKAAVAAVASDISTRNAELTRINTDQQRVRENMKALKGSTEEQQLLKRYATQLNQQEDRVDAIRRELDDLQRKLQATQADLASAIEALTLDAPVTSR